MFMFIQDVTLSAACAPPGGGRNPVSPRLFRHFSMLSIPSPTEHSLRHMFMVGLFSMVVCSSPGLLYARVPDQKGVSQAWYIAEIQHSGRKPSNCAVHVCFVLLFFSFMTASLA